MSNSIGEETYAETGKMELTDEYTWIVDPIDGEYQDQICKVRQLRSGFSQEPPSTQP